MSDEKPMTKGEVRAWFKRMREDLRDAERALLDGNETELVDAVQDLGGCAARIEDAARFFGIRGVK